MNLEGDDIEVWVRTVAARANRFVIVSPFFSLNTKMRNWIEGISNLQILIGDEFSTNNPHTLKELSDVTSTDIRCIYKDRFGKRLHAKVIFAEEASGRCQALVGSANFTVSGLTKNKEQAISLDSKVEIDRPILDKISQWISELQDSAHRVDWNQAETEYQKSSNRIIRTEDFGTNPKVQNYWVLKTTPGGVGKNSYWPLFVKEGVVSIGWEDIIKEMGDRGLKPSEYRQDTLRVLADEYFEYNSRRAAHGAKTIYWFSREFSKHDRVIICNGYTSTQNVDVKLYGLAIIKGCTYDHSESCWWRLKCMADIQRMEIDIPKEVFTSTLERSTLLHTIHRIEKEQYERFFSRIQEF